MLDLRRDANNFVVARREERRSAARMVAFRLATGLDLATALASPPRQRRLTILRLERLLERERQRGWARHWSYDLNRHIALKDALDELRLAESAVPPS